MTILGALYRNGFKKTIYQLLTHDEARCGTLVGRDALGNQYFGMNLGV